jgi:hypothetical protein
MEAVFTMHIDLPTSPLTLEMALWHQGVTHRLHCIAQVWVPVLWALWALSLIQIASHDGLRITFNKCSTKPLGRPFSERGRHLHLTRCRMADVWENGRQALTR